MVFLDPSFAEKQVRFRTSRINVRATFHDKTTALRTSYRTPETLSFRQSCPV